MVFLKPFAIQAEDAGLITLINTGDTCDTIEGRIVLQVHDILIEYLYQVFPPRFLANIRKRLFP